MTATTEQVVLAVAEAIAVVEMHAGFIRDGQFQPGPNTMRIAEGVVAHLTQQGWTVTPAPTCLTCEDVGWITVPDHACGGNDRICAEACPAPTQVRCPECDTEDNQPTSDGEDPF